MWNVWVHRLMLQNALFCLRSWPIEVSLCNWKKGKHFAMHMLCACLHKTHIHTYIRTHSVSGDTRLSKLLTKNQGFASCIKYRHFARSTPKFVHGRNSTSIRLAYPQMQGFVPYFCPIALQSSIKNLLHCIDKVWGITNLGHKAGGAFSGQKAEWVWSRSWNLGHKAGGTFSGQRAE